METKSKSKVLSSGMHVAHCTTYRQSPWISPETALPKPGQKIAFVVDQGPSATDRYWYDTGELAEDGDWCGVECLFETVLWWLALPELPPDPPKEAKQ